MTDGKIWKRPDAEKKIAAVFDMAKAGEALEIHDAGGHFELRYIATEKRERASEVLARGGPVED